MRLFLPEKDCSGCLDHPLSLFRLRHIFVLLAKYLYSDPLNYGEFTDALRPLVYTGKDDSSLWVDLLQAFDPKAEDVRPAVYVGARQQNFEQIGANNSAAISDDGATKSYAWRATATITYAHLHEDPDVALMLAETSATFLMGIRDLLAEKLLPLGLQAYQPLEISDIQPERQRPQKGFRVDFACKLVYDWAVDVSVESHRIKKFAQILNLE